MTDSGENKFVAYEYMSVPVNQTMETLYIDCYKSFGWTLDSSLLSLSNPGAVVLKFKRDRRINNRTEVSELQRKCESALTSLKKLEDSKTSTAMMTSIIIGTLGAGSLVGAFFSYQAELIFLFVLLTIIGCIGVTLSYLRYNKLVDKKTSVVTPLIDQQYEIIYDVCDEANKLIV